MDSAKRSVIGYQVSDNRGVGPCILAMRMAFRHLKELPKNFKFIADGYSAYPLAAQQFFHEFGDKFKFEITQVIGLTNDDEVSKEFRPYKQMIERLNRTYKASYRKTNGFDNIDGANYDLALWVAYYNFLRPHKHNNYKVLNEVEMLSQADTMLGKWQLHLPWSTDDLNLQHGEAANCSRFRARGNYPSHRKAACPDGTKKNCYTAVIDGKTLTVLEFFAVSDSYSSSFRTVKSGGGLPQPKRSTVFKVHLSLFLLLSFFIGHLTLSKYFDFNSSSIYHAKNFHFYSGIYLHMKYICTKRRKYHFRHFFRVY